MVFYELTRKFVETEEDVPQEACDVLYYTLAVGHHTGVLDCFEPRLSVPVDVFNSLVDALQELRDIDHPIVLHASTAKGKGFASGEMVTLYYDPEDPEKMYVEGDRSVLGAEILYFCLAVVLLALMVSFSR